MLPMQETCVWYLVRLRSWKPWSEAKKQISKYNFKNSLHTYSSKVYTWLLVETSFKILLKIYKPISLFHPFVSYLLKKLGQVSHSLDVADCMPMVLFKVFLCPCISGNLGVGPLLMGFRFDFLARLPKWHCVAHMAGCLSFNVIADWHSDFNPSIHS